MADDTEIVLAYHESGGGVLDRLARSRCASLTLRNFITPRGYRFGAIAQ